MNVEQFETVKRYIKLTSDYGSQLPFFPRIKSLDPVATKKSKYSNLSRVVITDYSSWFLSRLHLWKILTKDELVKCSPENLKIICEKFLPKFHYSTLQLQDSSVGPTKLEWETIYQRLVVERRGGLCYERDEVLWQLLNYIGYEG